MNKIVLESFNVPIDIDEWEQRGLLIQELYTNINSLIYQNVSPPEARTSQFV
jgi:hypothetical protein